MEYVMNPTFTDPVILKFLDENWLSNQPSKQVWRVFRQDALQSLSALIQRSFHAYILPFEPRQIILLEASLTTWKEVQSLWS